MTSSSFQPYGNLRNGSPGWQAEENRDQKYQCPDCWGGSFPTAESYSHHVMQVHKINPSSGNSGRFRVTKCEPLKATRANIGRLPGFEGKRNTGDYAQSVCNSPDSSDSEQAVRDDVDRRTSSPPIRGNESPPAEYIGRLSLDRASTPAQNRGGRGILRAAPALASKRSASSDLQGPPSRRNASGAPFRASYAGALRDQRTSRRHLRRADLAASQHPVVRDSSRVDPMDMRSWSRHHTVDASQYHGAGPKHPIPRDSGYDTQHSRSSTLQHDSNMNPQDDAYVSLEPLSSPGRSSGKDKVLDYVGGVSLVRSKFRWPGLVLQPESSPISQDQLAAEVKGIYGGLVMVEAKCINIDAAQAADPNSILVPEQWQALIALHRTLLYEHHDFLMATQHPSATPALRELAQKYSMPARMWRHGIHAFLEVLRHRRPHSQDYMVAFVYLAYQMMALLFETVPSFTDTWIECLGDLARYRMAIEEDKETHSIWGGVAASWYNTASDRHPSIGRLYHHLGILERPGIRKLFLYSKSLTCVIPFPNARDSLGTLYGPLAQTEQPSHSGMRLAEFRVLRFHANLFVNPKNDKLPQLASEACSALDQCPSVELREAGVFTIVAVIAALLERGFPNNVLWQLYGNALNADIQSARPSAAAMSDLQLSNDTETDLSSPTLGTHASPPAYDFYCSSFHSLLGRGSSPQTNKDTLRAIHAILVWVHSIQVLRSKLNNDHDIHTLHALLSPTRFPWFGLCTALNVLCQKFPIDSQIMENARQGIFPNSGSSRLKPLLEDYQLRGLIWTQWYYPEDFFGDQGTDEEAHMENSNPAVEKSRVERLYWLALYQVFHGEYIKFNSKSSSFWAPEVQKSLKVVTDEVDQGYAATAHSTSAKLSKSPSPTTTPPQSDSDDFVLVEAPKPQPKQTWANVVSKSNKVSQVEADIYIMKDEEMREAG